ncbi:succinate dehydrogenase flavoprotein subunit [Alphaproteobacteria bacterium]|nr:succinate dehydrogenase flavoprotein subunit [Alphaproteobacteria bacterium]
MKKNFTIKKFEVLIIGAGGAGLMSAISACDNGLKNVAIISKVLPTHSHTVSAKGGINASLANVKDDNWKWHAYDTIKGADYLADVDAVEILCKSANQAILELEKFGVVFSRDDNGKIAQRAYGGQTLNFGSNQLAYRACYAQDKTGHTITHTLEQQALNRAIKFLNEFFVCDLLIENNKIYGCLAIDLNIGELVVIISDQVVLACGGYCQIYRNTTSSTICSGDGSALVLKEGLFLQDMEFIQFHPTGIYGSGFLITEAVRGEGAYLVNALGQRFMEKYAKNMMELASRDIISQAIAQEISLGNIDPKIGDCVFLDMRHLSEETLVNKIPNVVEMVKKFCGKDVRKDLIAVAPSAHYSMGGVPCQTDCLVLEGLYAVGEVACLSVHGANRLGCNSLLDLMVFGKIVGENLSKNYQRKTTIAEIDFEKTALNIAEQKITKFNLIFDTNNNSIKTQNCYEIKEILHQINEKCLGVYRNKDLLEEGFEVVKDLYKKFKTIKITNKQLIWNEELIEYLELENLLLNSLACYFSAINRKESRGAHFRFDYPNRNDQEFLAHSLVRIIDFKEIKMEFKLKPVKNVSLINELNLDPQSRKY